MLPVRGSVQRLLPFLAAPLVALPASPDTGSRLPCNAMGLKGGDEGVYTWIAYAATWLIWVATALPLEPLVDLHGLWSAHPELSRVLYYNLPGPMKQKASDTHIS